MRRPLLRARQAADMGFVALAGGGLTPRSSRDFVPAADSLSCANKKVSKEIAPAKPPGEAGCPAMLEDRGPRKTPAATLWSNSCAESVLEARKRAPRSSVLLGGLEGEAPNSRNSQTRNPAVIGLFIHPPSEPAEERRTSSPRAKHASTSDSRRLFEQSVAARVRRAGLKSVHRRAARCAAEGRAVRGRLFAFFLVAQKEGRPPGRTPGMGLAKNTPQPEASKCL